MIDIDCNSIIADYGDACAKMVADIDTLKAMLKASADKIEAIAFAIPAPNPHTPELVMLANLMRDGAV